MFCVTKNMLCTFVIIVNFLWFRVDQKQLYNLSLPLPGTYFPNSIDDPPKHYIGTDNIE